MEIYSNTTRFALACNQSNKIIEPIQSRCAIIRYSKLSDEQLLKRLIEICKAEKVRCVLLSRMKLRSNRAQVEYAEEGLASLIFTAEGDMRQAINNLQSTASGFGFVSADAVFKVCDQPHPVTVTALLSACSKGDIDGAMEKITELWDHGYSAVDIVTTVFRVTKSTEILAEYMKLQFIKVRLVCCRC